MFFAWQETMTSEGYSSPAQCLKYTKAGLGIPGENIINYVPFPKKFWLQKKLNFTN